jgi:hypothetical protein
MYRSWAQMKEGWTKNLALLFPNPSGLAIIRAAEFAVIFGGVAYAIPALAMGLVGIGSIILLLGVLNGISFFGRIRRAHLPIASNLLAVFGLPIFAHLLLRSAALHRNSAVTWKGRTYGSIRTKTVNRESPNTSS